jgi:hypothetical protein
MTQTGITSRGFFRVMRLVSGASITAVALFLAMSFFVLAPEMAVINEITNTEVSKL